MQSVSENVVAWSLLHKARQSLNEQTFENIVFRFASIVFDIPKNANRQYYERALGHFRVQYYNEFLYNVIKRSEECCRFIQTLSSFTIHAKFQKKNYIDLFTELLTFYTGSMGGTYNGKPLLMEPAVDLIKAPALHLKWNWDQVMLIRTDKGFTRGRCAVCSKRGAIERKLGIYLCPASSLPLCDSCEMDSAILDSYLQDCQSLTLPAPSEELQEHLKGSLDVCQRLAIASNRPNLLQDLRFSVLEHGEAIVAENVRLVSSNRELKRTLAQLQQQSNHAFASNDEYRVSMYNLNESRYILEKQLQQQEQQVKELQGRLDESIRQQWLYYNQLRGD